MNKLFSIALLPVALLLFGASSEEVPPAVKSNAEEATVYFHRGNQFGSALQNFVPHAVIEKPFAA